MTGAVGITDPDRFRRLWEAGATVARIAEVFGTGKNAVYTARRRFGLAPRRGGWQHRLDAGEAAEAAEAADPDAARILRMLERVECARENGRVMITDFWTWKRDAAVCRASGSYDAMADLAARWGVSSTRVVARWNVLRSVR